MIDTQLNRLSVLAHADRLSVFRLLVRRLPETVPAGEIARSLSLKPSTLSAHLSALQNAGLASHSRQGTTLLYRADLDGAESLVSFLFEDCCRGRADLCQPRHPAQSSPGNILKEKRFSVLFICSGNSTRSIIAETLLRAEAGDRFIAYSAGTRPRSEINPATIRFLRSKGHDTTALRAKHVSEFQGPEAPRSISSLPSATARRTRNVRPGPASRSPPIGAFPIRTAPVAPMPNAPSPFNRPMG